MIPTKFISMREIATRNQIDNEGEIESKVASILGGVRGETDYVRLRVDDKQLDSVLAAKREELARRESLANALKLHLEISLVKGALGISATRIDDILNQVEIVLAKCAFLRITVAGLEKEVAQRQAAKGE